MDKEYLKLYEGMLRIRLFEERIAQEVENGVIGTPCHLYIGEEAAAVGVCAELQDSDYVFSNYRGHGHYLARGCPANEMIAEILGRATGCSRGRGGSMHLVCSKKNFMGSSAIVAGNISLAVGAGFRAKMDKDAAVSIVFFGDGATEEGVFFEAVNFAALKRLPVIFICENNYAAAHMRLKDRQPLDTMSEKVQAFMPAYTVDGNNVLEVRQAASVAVENARNGAGPSFIECKTFRWRGHVGPNLDIDKGLRTQEEIDLWMRKCPIKRLAAQIDDQKALSTIREKIQAEVVSAFQFAIESPFPNPDSLEEDVYG